MQMNDTKFQTVNGLQTGVLHPQRIMFAKRVFSTGFLIGGRVEQFNNRTMAPQRWEMRITVEGRHFCLIVHALAAAARVPKKS